MRKAIATVLLVLGAPAFLAAQRQNNPSQNPGRPLFEAHCAACHGLDGRGGEAPNITTTPAVQALSDVQLTTVIHDGHTGGMPGFASMLSDAEIASVVSFLRELQHGGVSMVAGNPANGKTLFFGSAGCSQCHAIKGQGGFLGADLSSVPLAADDIRAAITTPPISSTDVLTTVVLKNGRKITGLARNEDNFSIQMIDLKGALISIEKADASKIDRATVPYMPSYATKLSTSDLQDLVAYVASQASTTGGGRGRRRQQ